MAFNSPFGKYKPKKIKAAPQPGRVGSLPAHNVRQDDPATAPPRPAGGQGPVTSTPVSRPIRNDESWKDSVYNQGESNIQTGLNNLGGYLLNQGRGLGLDYGVDTGNADPTKFDPANPSTFNVDWDKVDVTNPFSRAALLVRTHRQNERGNTNSYAARGQLYAGSLQNAQNEEGFRYQGGQDALLKDFSSKWGGLYGQWLQAQQAGGQQSLDNLAAAQARHQNDPAAPEGYNTGGAAAPGSTQAQAANQPQGQQPKEVVSPALKAWLEKQKNAKVKPKPKHPKYKNTGGAKAPGGN